MHYKLPKKQGLYDPKFEHDNCGIGFIVNIDGIRNHKIVKNAIQILKNLTHRGGVGFEDTTGDGAGILTQIPHKFMQKVCKIEGINLPKEQEYGVGMLFCSQDSLKREKVLDILKKIIEENGQKFLGIRSVPIFNNCIGESAKRSMPCILQVFIEKAKEIKDTEDFERKLFIILKQSENEIRYGENNLDPYFYFASLSSKTIVYKGMLTPDQVDCFYLDLLDLDFESAIAMVHSRFSTNTFPSWERAHPNRYIIHNGEINTIRGNVNWVKAREKVFKTNKFSEEELEKILPVINEDGSDSSMFDNYIQMLNLSGYSLPKAIMMSIPEPWENDLNMAPEKRAFYRYSSLISEAWDGPAAIAFTDGDLIGATLDRNGLRPARYYITSDNTLVLASEVGVLPIYEENIIKKGRLSPGKMLLIDTKSGRLIEDSELKESVSKANPYEQWINQNLLNINDLEEGNFPKNEEISLLEKQKAFGYVVEDLENTIKEICEKGEDPIMSMGNDAPLAIFSEKNQLLYNYFKQLFAQVTNPPIDAIREKVVTSSLVYLGGEGNLLVPSEENCKRIELSTPILSNSQISKIENLNNKDFKSAKISILYNKNETTMAKAIEEIYKKIDFEIENGANILILSDRGVNKDNINIPLLLISSGVHHYLIKTGKRIKVSIVLESGEPREVHHFALLVGYGSNAINPYLVFETISEQCKNNKIEKSEEEAINSYISGVTKGIVKVASKMGISTLQSYQGAQIFEAVGLNQDVVDKFFTNTTTRIGGLSLLEIEKEAILKHENAFSLENEDKPLEVGGDYKWLKNGEYHMFNPKTVNLLQKAVRQGDYSIYKEYAKLMNSHNEGLCTIRSMFDILKDDKPIPLDEVESVESIVKRFKTGAMSYGSLSKEAHECLAVAMNRLGGKSNSGEGGENSERFKPLENGDSKCSAIKQVASGRFGVSINYLQNAVEIQIKMAQGAKPGEGGHLPGKKVYPWIAKSRNSTTGVDLISPPPHHDIYSIEDLAQLIHDLKNANRNARISVKLVSEAGVGTIAVGVAKSLADVILISGYDGGTGAAPRTSVRHAGLPWELGLAETHQALLLNKLRNRVVLEADGKMLTGRDILIASLLGAEEFGFSTAPLVAIGCVMARVCHLDTCPVGVATQNPTFRERFKGKPEHVENLMIFLAQDLREHMAELGFKTVQDMIGHVERLKPRKVSHWKAKTVDLTSILYQAKTMFSEEEKCFNTPQNHGIEKSFDYNTLLELCKPAINEDKKIEAKFKITNINRVCGTILSSDIAKLKGENGLKEDSINLNFQGSAGQSFGAFLIKGITLNLTGDANDYVGKGLSGGKIIVKMPENSKLSANENVIIGNVALFGATSGEAYINGIAGERFCVRNSGACAVVEGIGSHGLEYMTGGKVVVLGETGGNFAAGMSGGVAYVYNEKGNFESKCNKELVLLEELDIEDIDYLRKMIENHFKYTNSELAKNLLSDFEKFSKKFVKVIPKVYKNVVKIIKEAEAEGFSNEEALMKAFEKSLEK